MSKPICRIRFLQDMFGNDTGDIVNVLSADNENLYYYDGFRRWCYMRLSDEGVEWEYVGKKRPVIEEAGK